MKYVFTRLKSQGDYRDTLKFDSSPLTAIRDQYGFSSVRLFELEEEATHQTRTYYVFATREGREFRYGILKELTREGIRALLREYER